MSKPDGRDCKAASVRVSELEAMLAASEEHTQLWEKRALAYKQALELIAGGQFVTRQYSAPFPIWIDGEEKQAHYVEKLSPAKIAKEALRG